MELKINDSVYIQSYKHNGKLHRTWAKGIIVEVTQQQIVLVTNQTIVSESDGRKWVTREPAVCFFYPKKWWNIICMMRKNGICYYCNIASPSIYDGEAIKNIDYDLDVKVMADGSWMILDEDEYNLHKKIMGYSKSLDCVLNQQLKELVAIIQKQKKPFQESYVYEYYNQYLSNQKKADL